MIDVPYEVKKALREGTYRKNYRFIVLHDDWTEDFTIDNDNLVKESVSIDERMCSGDTIKYGLCEGSSLEFQYFMPEKGQYEANKTYMRNDLVHSNGVAWRSRTDNNTGNPLVEGDYWAEWVKPNITGRRVQAFVDVDYKKVITQYSWETQEQFSTAFTVTDMSGDCRLYTELDSAWDFVYVTENGTTTQVYPTATESGTIIELGDVTGRTLIVSLPVIPAPTADLQLLVPHVGPAILTHPIPLGFFDVKKCSRQASTGIIKVTAYNKLQSDYLDAKANELIETAPSDMSDGTTTTLYTILQQTLSDYGIDNRTEPELDLNSYGTGEGIQTSTVSIKLIGYSGSYYPAISTTRQTQIRITTYIPEGSMIRLDISDYVALLQRSIQSMKNAFFDQVVDAETKWATAVRDTGLLQDNASMIVSFYGDLYGHFYTLSNEVRTLPEAHNHPIENVVNLYNVSSLTFVIPYRLVALTGNTVFKEIWKNSETLDSSIFEGKLKMIEASDLTAAELINVDVNTLPDVTLRELQSAVYETSCQFGQLSRTTDLFSGVELGHSRLLPAETLYPATDLYPSGARLSGSKAMYSKLWADEGNIHKWRYLIITYKGLDEEQNEKEFTLQRTVNSDGTDDYNCSDNWLFRNLIWTDEQIGDYADAMVAKMQGITWFPFEMWCAGLPYLETGDEIEIPLGDQKYVSYVLQRQLKGIQNLQDTYINGTLDIY